MECDYDLFVIGGGVNGCGVARDAVGRGHKVGLAEMDDIGGATSSASTKLFHGGLRYLEYFEFSLVRHSLIERERLLRNMPHISWPMRFVLPLHREMRFESTTPASRLLSFFMPWMKGRRPAWMIRFGLFMYDHMGGRKILPVTSTLDLSTTPEGKALNPKFERAFEYSDCWVEDARLVALNARDAFERGADILTRTKVVGAERKSDHWVITLQEAGDVGTRDIKTKVLVNAAGPWVEDVVRTRLRQNTSEGVRLVRGSHIVVDRLFEHDKCYFFQGEDGRIIFAIPYETDFTLIGTTDADHWDLDEKPAISDEERDYLIDFINPYLAKPISTDDIRWTYSGVRPLYDDGASSAAAATRDYVLSLNNDAAPILSIFGGKITSYRDLAEHVLRDLSEVLPLGTPWTEDAPLPGGDFAVDGVGDLLAKLKSQYPFITDRWALRLIRAYGTDAFLMLGKAKFIGDLGENFGADLTAAEVHWLATHEFVRTTDDILWRRSKLGLRVNDDQIARLGAYLKKLLSEQT